MDVVKVFAFIGFGIFIGQIWVHFALLEFVRDCDKARGAGDD